TGEILRTIPKERDYPDAQTLPVPPSSQQPRPLVTLSELIPGKYISTTARIVYLKTIERQDALGSKLLFSGIVEDSTFKVPFVSHKILYPLIRNSIYKFNSAYVHEFPLDKSLILVITEHTKIDAKNIEDYRDFIWNPTIESIKRPVKSISLQGVITTIHSNSGLVKRCNKCRSIIYDFCPNECLQEGWSWDLRVSSRLYNGSGSIKMVLTKDMASKVLHRNLSELVLLASQDNNDNNNKPSTHNYNYNNNNKFQQQQPSSVFTLKIPDTIEVIEAVTENVSSSYRSNGKLIVTDGRNLVHFPPNGDEHKDEQKFSESVKRPLKFSDAEDKKIIKRMIQKALDISIKKATGMRMMQGIYLLEEPISLYRCERAKLYLGFSVKLNLRKDDSNEVAKATVELTPQAYVRESVLDYVRLRRERGATANAIVRNLLTYRNKVVVAPSGNYGSIVDVITKKAGTQLVSDTDSRNLVEFWKQIYGIDISPDEIPLLKVKMMNSENVFTYPPSMCFFGNDSLLIQGNVQKFIENKKYNLKAQMDDVITKAVIQQDLKIGSAKLELEELITSKQADIQSQLLEEIRQKLFGRNVTAKGSIIFVHDELWFFPNQVHIS
ncbi:MAG TPA: hypothetical protein VFJ51_11525, partial [Nitrososphaeraceae archaeon]|nr:hypothetical protein [Nitrososphaeraceae archaeon]